jgi:protein-S-isoprenylcysteine O-methyltransferase Ste14
VYCGWRGVARPDDHQPASTWHIVLVVPEAKGPVTAGLYSKIQHPMFVFLNLFLAAVIVGLGWPILLWVWAILVAAQSLQAPREEEVLAAASRSDHETYRNRTWF